MQVYFAADGAVAWMLRLRTLKERIVGIIHASRLMCRSNCAVGKNATSSRVSIVEISLCGCYIETMFTMAVGGKSILDSLAE